MVDCSGDAAGICSIVALVAAEVGSDVDEGACGRTEPRFLGGRLGPFPWWRFEGLEAFEICIHFREGERWCEGVGFAAFEVVFVVFGEGAAEEDYKEEVIGDIVAWLEDLGVLDVAAICC